MVSFVEKKQQTYNGSGLIFLNFQNWTAYPKYSLDIGTEKCAKRSTKNSVRTVYSVNAMDLTNIDCFFGKKTLLLHIRYSLATSMKITQGFH